MAPKSIRKAISDALDHLEKGEVEKFCYQLSDREKNPIPAAAVLGKSNVRITAVLVQTYTEKGALKVVLQTLRDAGFQQTAENLEKATRKPTQPKPKNKAGGASAAAASEQVTASDTEDETDSSEDPAVNFILGQKVKLIHCLGADDLILQLAHQNKVITRSQYKKLKSISSMEDVVTGLIDMVMDKGAVHCRLFLQILKECDVVDTYPMLKEIMKDWN